MPLASISTFDGVVRIIWCFTAPVQTVWSGITDRSLLPQWLGQPLECDLRAGGGIIVDHGGGTLSRSVVTGLVPQQRLAMTWEFPDEPASSIGLTLSGQPGAGTTMEFSHSGLGSLVGSYVPGWITHLTYLEAALSGAPLSSSQFWPLYASFEVLCAAGATSGRVA